MIFVSHQLPVNVPGEPRLDRAAVWDGQPEQAAAALRGYASVVPTLPRTVGWHAALKHDMPALPFVPPEYVGKRLLMLISMWLDDAEDPEGAEMIARLTEIGEPCIKATTVLPFGACTSTCSTSTSRTAWSKPSAARRSTPS